MTSLARKEMADRVLAYLRDHGPQSTVEVKEGLGITKREAEDAIHLLMSRALIEYVFKGRGRKKAEREDFARRLNAARASLKTIRLAAEG